MLKYIQEFGWKSWALNYVRPKWTRICWRHFERKVPNYEWYYWECKSCKLRLISADEIVKRILKEIKN